MGFLSIDNEALHKARMRRDNAQLATLVALSAILCFATVVLVGSDLLLDKSLLKRTLCHEQGPASGNAGS